MTETDDYVLLDKPGGVPVHASLDNSIETALECTTRALSHEASSPPCSLYSLHRLDVPTHGLLVMGKTLRFTSHFNALLRDRRVHKEYKALTWHPPALGKHVHYMENSRRSPKALSTHAQKGWQECVLVVHRVERKDSAELSPPALAIMREQLDRSEGRSAAATKHAPGAVQGMVLEAYQVWIELHTGRTHQIRAQMSALGCPLVGDEMYGTSSHALSLTSPLAASEGASQNCEALDHEELRPGEGGVEEGEHERGKKRLAGDMEDGAKLVGGERVGVSSGGEMMDGGGAGSGGGGNEGLGGEGVDAHADKWLAREMEIRGSLALQAYKISFPDLPAATPPAQAAQAESRPKDESAVSTTEVKPSSLPTSYQEHDRCDGTSRGDAGGEGDRTERGRKKIQGRTGKGKGRQRMEKDEEMEVGEERVFELLHTWWLML